MNSTLDLPNRCRQPHEKPRNPTCGRLPEADATWLAPVRFTRNPSSTGLTKKKLRPCSIFTNNTSVFTTLALRKRLGVDASYINLVANGEHQSEKLRRALLSELCLRQAAA
jgi:hypothetical protein